MTRMPSPLPPSPSNVEPGEGNAAPRGGKLRAFRYLRNHSGSTSKGSDRERGQAPSPPPGNADPRERDSRHRPSPQPSNNTPTRDTSPFEAWLESSLQAARLPASGPTSAPHLPNDMPSSQGGQGLTGTSPEGTSGGLQGLPQDQIATIKLIPHQDPRSNRPSLSFPPTQRTLPHEDCIIRVGRYSERDANPNPPPNTPSSAPIGFKSKVVSRRHCEFWCSQGQWYIKDVKSSSGTFLNHIRLSQPNIESRPWPVNDGDVVQLGIDFRGGEEMIFRCVKIRVECNRAWQKTLNNYNVSTHKRLRDLGRAGPAKDSDAASTHSSECSICLMSIAPCQSLFVAPCSHVWHYKCIRPILNDHKTWPQFLCPNCRAVTDLEAEIDDPNEQWPDDDFEVPPRYEPEAAPHINGSLPDGVSGAPTSGAQGRDEELADLASRHLNVGEDNALTPTITASSDPTNGSSIGATAGSTTTSLLDRRGAAPMPSPFVTPGESTDTPRSTPMEFLRPITPTEPLMGDTDLQNPSLRTPTNEQLVTDGPMTPTNNAGPFVFDGSAGRSS